MAEKAIWRAGFEVEVVLGHLNIPRFQRELEAGGAMDRASHAYCQAVAALLRQHTGRRWMAPRRSSSKPGYYVISEYGLDPLYWPEDRLAGVELLTPPLPLPEADSVRREIIRAIDEIDGEFNFWPSDVTADCAWHINIDPGEEHNLDPEAFIVGVDELLLLSRNDRLFSKYAGLQRHSVGFSVLRHLDQDPQGKLLRPTLPILLSAHAGRGKSFAANFDKLLRGYLELRHFSAASFFDGPSLIEQLERILPAMEVPFNQTALLGDLFFKKFMVLATWLASTRERISWQVGPFNLMQAEGLVSFDDAPIGTILFDGSAELHLHGRKRYDHIAALRGFELPDVAEAVALLALDLAELRNFGAARKPSSSKVFQNEIVRLANVLKADPELSSDHQLAAVRALAASEPSSTAR